MEGKMRLNKEELAVGAVFGLSLMPFVGWWSILTAAVCSLLWALGGSYNKLWRRTGCAVIVEAVMIALGLPIGFHILSFWGVFGSLCIGYGIPSFAPKDEGSWLGQRVYRLVRSDMEASVVVRVIIAGCLAISLLPLCRVSAWHWILTSLILIVGMPLAFLFVEGEINV